MIVVFDTDVLVPMILPASKSARLFRRLDSDGHLVAISPDILAELTDKLHNNNKIRQWLGRTDHEIDAYLAAVPKICLMTPGVITIQGIVTADPDDDKILAAALESRADYVVSEDKHLRALDPWLGIRLMNRDDFMAELDRLGVP